MSDDLIKKIEEKYPFLSICQYAGDEYIGIIMNRDKSILTMYDYDMIEIPELKKHFLELGETWWWESSRNIPINLFLKHEWDVFKNYKRVFTNKNVKILCGPNTSLTEIAIQKKKRKSIILVRRVE
jgi:hypothetical protein